MLALSLIARTGGARTTGSSGDTASPFFNPLDDTVSPAAPVRRRQKKPQERPIKPLKLHCVDQEPSADGAVLDPTFGCGGVLTTELGGASVAYDVAVQPAGKIVVVGGSGMYRVGWGDNNVAD